jgi:actin beta/gamma 1
MNSLKIKSTFVWLEEDFSCLEPFFSNKESHHVEKNYELPDGRKILIGEERFKATEILFQPNKGGFDLQGVHKYCYDSVLKCDVNVRKDLF